MAKVMALDDLHRLCQLMGFDIDLFESVMKSLRCESVTPLPL